MSEKRSPYRKGDWIVHRIHGVGQIHDIEVKTIRGRENKYRKIVTQNSTYWIPTDKMNEDWLRPLASAAEINDALNVVQSEPVTMDSDPLKRGSRIREAKLDYSPMVTAEIIRDLTQHKKVKKSIPPAEMDALRDFVALFLTEWSTCMKMDMGVVELKLKEMLARA